MVEQLIRMSLTAGIVIMVVILIRALMRKLPKKFSYMLWAAVGFRLLCPISIESRFSIFNAKPAVSATDRIENSRVYTNYIRHTSPAAHMPGAGHPVSDAHQVTQAVAAPEVTEAVTKTPSIDAHTVMLAIWAVIAVLIVGYAVYHLIRLKVRMRGAKQVERGIYESPLVTSPFAMGLIHPGIYLPVDLPEFEREYLIEHERTHIRRGDLIFKMIAVTALAIHWFNPLVWVAFVLFCRDMEMSCDEIVLEKLGVDIRKNYSLSLVALASKSQDYSYVVMPTSFSKSSVGKTEVKMRIKNIMSFKKSSRSVAALAGMIVIAVMLTCVLNACAPAEEKTIESTTTQETTTSQTTEETTSEPEETEEEMSLHDQYWSFIGGGRFVSTNGELEDQMEYMVLVSDYPEQELFVQDISDTSGIDDADVRDAAQYYMDQGYQVFDQENELARRDSLGDGEYMFRDGFYAVFRDTTGTVGQDGDWIDTCYDVYVYKMNETLFDYFIVEGHSFSNSFCCTFVKPRDIVEDDGTVIRYTDSYTGTVAEFDRDTGLATITIDGSSMSTRSSINSIENDDLREIAQSYYDQGCELWFFDVNEQYYFDLFYEMDYPYGFGFDVMTVGEQDPVLGGYSSENLGTYYTVDEDMFEAIVDSGYYGDEATREDDGTVVSLSMEADYEYEDYDGSTSTWHYSCNLEFNRDTNILVVTNESYDY